MNFLKLLYRYKYTKIVLYNVINYKYKLQNIKYEKTVIFIIKYKNNSKEKK